tara:strand:- start:1988 stop:2443 length:456 start_codon:yes stop_codon:yes gene_type:complete
MTSIIVGEEQWRKLCNEDFGQYGNITVVVCTMSNGTKIYFRQDGDVKEIKKFCTRNKLYIKDVAVRFRSHEISIDTKDSEAIYIVKGVKGSLASDTTYCIILGSLVNGFVHKTSFSTPDLIEVYSDKDPVENCFEEALIYNDKETNEEEHL